MTLVMKTTDIKYTISEYEYEDNSYDGGCY